MDQGIPWILGNYMDSKKKWEHRQIVFLGGTSEEWRVKKEDMKKVLDSQRNVRVKWNEGTSEFSDFCT